MTTPNHPNLDCQKYIDYLLDRTEDWATRIAAAERLMYYPSEAAKATLFRITVDSTEPDWLREETAGSLGTLWATSLINYEQLREIPLPFLDEVLLDFDAYGVILDMQQLGDKAAFFLQRYAHRSFITTYR